MLARSQNGFTLVENPDVVIILALAIYPPIYKRQQEPESSLLSQPRRFGPIETL